MRKAASASGTTSPWSSSVRRRSSSAPSSCASPTSSPPSASTALPTFTTRYDMKNRDFVDRVGVTARETFAPADIELEPDFRHRRRVAGLPRHLAPAPAGPAHGRAVPLDGRLRLQVRSRPAGPPHRHVREAVGQILGPGQGPHARAWCRACRPTCAAAPFRRSPCCSSRPSRCCKDLMALERHSVERKGRPLHAREVWSTSRPSARRSATRSAISSFRRERARAMGRRRPSARSAALAPAPRAALPRRPWSR